jgi:uncharacterized protein YigE (DUF2233 family)
MKNNILAGCLLLMAMTIHAQVESFTNYSFGGSSYNVFIVKVDTESVRKFEFVENKNRLSHNDFLVSLNDTACFVINAGTTDSLCRPVGYLSQNNQELMPVNLRDSIGNFYLKPNGLLLFTNNDAIFCESSQLGQYKHVRVGIQSGPMLLINGTIHPLFNQNSANKHLRTGAGSFKNSAGEKFVVFAISNNPVSFYTFASFFKERFKCTDALCLESAGCAMYYPGYSILPGKYNGMICNYLYLKL